MTKKKPQPQAPPVDEWTTKEWEIAYGNKCKELILMRDHMKQALQHLTKAI